MKLPFCEKKTTTTTTTTTDFTVNKTGLDILGLEILMKDFRKYTGH